MPVKKINGSIGAQFYANYFKRDYSILPIQTYYLIFVDVLTKTVITYIFIYLTTKIVSIHISFINEK